MNTIYIALGAVGAIVIAYIIIKTYVFIKKFISKQ